MLWGLSDLNWKQRIQCLALLKYTILLKEKEIPWENLPVDCTCVESERIVRSSLSWNSGKDKGSAALDFVGSWKKACFFQLQQEGLKLWKNECL